MESSSDASAVRRVRCTDDGALTAVATETPGERYVDRYLIAFIPALSVYLTRIPMRAAAYRQRIALLASLTEVAVHTDGATHAPIIFNAKLEPSLLAIGARHLAVAFNNRAWFYEIRKSGESACVC